VSLLPSLQNLRARIHGVTRGAGNWLWALPAGIWVWAARLAWSVTLIFLFVLAVVQWVFVARLHHYQADIEQHASALLGQSVQIGHLQGHWRGLHPGIVLDQLDLIDAQGKPSLSLKQVAVFLSWKSLFKGEPVVDLLVIDSPVLHIRRTHDGKVTIAGFGTEGETDPEAFQRLLSLRQLRIQHAEIVWEDQLRQAPPLVLQDVNFGLDNIRYLHLVHRFGLTATPPEHLASRLDIRGEWEGWEGDFESILAGRLFAELASADLAAWQPWVDYHSVLTQGRGGVRLWAEHLQEKPSATLDVGLADVRLTPGRGIPNIDVGRLQGRFMFSGEKNAGTFTDVSLSTQNLSAQSVRLDWPDFFPAAPLHLDAVATQFSWKENSDGWLIDLAQFNFANADAVGQLHGRYAHSLDGARKIDLQGDVSRVEASAVWRYLPSMIGVETRKWVRDGLLSGKASEGKLVLQGDLRKFPFHTSEDGLFRISAKVQGGSLDYAKRWPRLMNIHGEVVFEQLGMRILSSDANFAETGISTVALGPVEVVMPDMETLDEQLHIKGVAQGQTAEFLGFIEQSPVGGLIGHATRDIKASGSGKLELAIDLPIRRLKDAKVQGAYYVHNNEVKPFAVLAPVQQVNGKIMFSELGVNIPGLNGIWLGQPAHFQGGGGNALNFVATGGLSIKEYRATLPTDHALQPLLAGISGLTQWKADIRVPPGKAPNWQVTTDLLGIASSLPEPLNKSATRKLPSILTVTPLTGAKTDSREQWLLRVDGVANALLQFKTSPEQWGLEKGVLAIGNTLPKLPESGLAIALKWPEFRIEEWQPLLADSSAEASTVIGNAAQNVATKRVGTSVHGFLPSPNQFSLETDRLWAMGRHIDRVSIQGVAVGNEGNDGNGADWQMTVNAPDVSGNVLWKPEGRGTVQADLKRLHLAKATIGTSPDSGYNRATEALGSKTLPALDIRVADFSLGDSKLGRLELKAENEGYRWKMPSVILTNPEVKLTGDAIWEMARGTGKSAVRDSTQLNFKLDTHDLGKFLDRLDYTGLVRRGNASMSGRLSWAGRPSGLDFASLNGSLQVHARDGQFAKIESGSGKLIGLLSLQALPRRFLLDFNDVFSEGFAFDKIAGDLQVAKGILRTQEPLIVDGAAAQIVMQGETDLAQETQNLQILVRPRFGGVASLGAAVAVNPVVGIASLLAQKILQDPLDRILSYQYRVTGSWADPIVVKE
jgi:uncharacterized protein (TIGR02099 family)